MNKQILAISAIVALPVALRLISCFAVAMQQLRLERLMKRKSRSLAQLSDEVLELGQEEQQYRRAYEELTRLDDEGRRQWVRA